jgi:hypothetical protein
MDKYGPPLWSSGEFLLQIQRFGFDSPRYHVFREIMSLERGPLSLVSTLKSYLEEKVAAPVSKIVTTAVGIGRAEHATPPPSIRKSWH